MEQITIFMTIYVASFLAIASLFIYLVQKIKTYSLEIEKNKNHISKLEAKIVVYENVKDKVNKIKKSDKTNANNVLKRMYDNKL